MYLISFVQLRNSQSLSGSSIGCSSEGLIEVKYKHQKNILSFQLNSKTVQYYQDFDSNKSTMYGITQKNCFEQCCKDIIFNVYFVSRTIVQKWDFRIIFCKDAN